MPTISGSPSLETAIAHLVQAIADFRTLCAQVDNALLTNEQVITLRAQDHAIQTQMDQIVNVLASHAAEKAA